MSNPASPHGEAVNAFPSNTSSTIALDSPSIFSNTDAPVVAGQPSYFDIPPRAPSPTGKDKKSWLQKKFSTSTLGGGSPGSGGSRERKRPSISGDFFGLGRKGSESSLNVLSNSSSTGSLAGLSSGPAVPPPMVTQDSSSSFVSALTDPWPGPPSRRPSVQDFRTAPSSPSTPLGGFGATPSNHTPTQTNNPSPTQQSRVLPSISTDLRPISPPMPPSEISSSQVVDVEPSSFAGFLSAPLSTSTSTRVSTVVEAEEGGQSPPKPVGLNLDSQSAPAETIDRHKATEKEPELCMEDLRSPLLDVVQSARDDDSSSIEGGDSESEEHLGPLADLHDEVNRKASLTSTSGGASGPLWPPATSAVLGRLDDILGLAAGQPTSRPSQLDDPPRKLLLHCPVLQVVNINVSHS